MGGDGCPRALDVRGVDGCDDGRADASAVRHRRGGTGGGVAGRAARAGAGLLRGGADRVWLVSGGGGGGDRLSGDRAVKDPASVRGPQQVRSSGYRPVVASADGRRADAGRGPVGELGGGEGSGQSARAGPARFDALPASALQAAVAPWPGVGPHRVDQGAPSVALSAGVRASQHGAGVHRQPRRLRRARGAQAVAIVAQPASRASASGACPWAKPSARACPRRHFSTCYVSGRYAGPFGESPHATSGSPASLQAIAAVVPARRR
jgi:hypothetical protein